MKLGTINKQPAEEFSYTINYEDALTEGDFVQTVVATVDPPGELVVAHASPMSPRIRFWASGGVDREIYKVEVTMTTEEGRIYQDELTFKIKEL